MTEQMVWINGDLRSREQATVSVYDKGFTSGDGVFETLKVISGRPFAQSRHLQRLENSGRLVGLQLPDREVFIEAIAETIDANARYIGDFGRLRITVSGGVALGRGIPGKDGHVTVVITADPQTPHPESLSIVSSPWVHNERGPLVGAKTTSYADNLATLAWARSQGADEAVMADTLGRVCEATTANVLIAEGTRLVTPTLATGCLGGVTRALLIEWGIVDECDSPFVDLRSTTEMLLASSTRDLIPVRNLDRRALASPGPLGLAAIEQFTARAAQQIDP